MKQYAIDDTAGDDCEDTNDVGWRIKYYCFYNGHNPTEIQPFIMIIILPLT